MRNPRSSMLVYVAVLAMGAVVQAGSITYDFNTAGDLNAYFSVAYQDSSYVVYTESATGGINDSRAITVHQKSRMESRFEKEPFTPTSWTQSIYIKAKTRTYFAYSENPSIAIGVASTDAGVVYPSSTTRSFLGAGLATRTDGYRLFLYSNNADDATPLLRTWSTNTFTFTADNWYYLTVTCAKQADGTYSMSGGIYNAADDGTVGIIITSKTWTPSNSTWLADAETPVASFSSSASASNCGIGMLDNYSVPEPATIALLSLGAVGVLRRKRR